MTDFNFFISAPAGAPLPALGSASLSLAAYRVGRGFRLQRAGTPDIRPALMEVDMLSFTGYGPHSALIFELTRECRLRGCRGMALWLPRPTVPVLAFCSALSAEADRLGLRLYLPEAYSRVSPSVRLIVDSRDIVGDFRAALLRRASEYAPNPLALRLDTAPADFALPALTGRGTPLSARALAALPVERFFYSEELCVNYASYVSKGRAHIVFLENERSLRDKLEIASSVPVPDVFMPACTPENLLKDLKSGKNVIK